MLRIIWESLLVMLMGLALMTLAFSFVFVCIILAHL